MDNTTRGTGNDSMDQSLESLYEASKQSTDDYIESLLNLKVDETLEPTEDVPEDEPQELITDPSAAPPGSEKPPPEEKKKHVWANYDPEAETLQPLIIRPVHGVTRNEWGAEPTTGPIKQMSIPLVGVILSYTGSRPCNTKEECKRQVRKLQRRDLAKGYPDIKYNFLIGGDGYVYEGRGWDQLPEKATKDYPQLFGKTIEIGMISRRGKYTSRKDKEREDKMHILVRKEIRSERMFLENKPTFQQFNTAFDLIEFGSKNKYIIQDKLILNVQ